MWLCTKYWTFFSILHTQLVMIDFCHNSVGMATRHYTEEALKLALQDICEQKLSLRKAALHYGIPKSTMSLYANRKLQLGGRPGPASILTPAEEQRLVDYAVHMAQIGYGCTRDQILNIVAQIVAKDGRKNPFVDGRPGRKWWSLFKKRNPTVTLRTPEKLQLARAKCCTPEILTINFGIKNLKSFSKNMACSIKHIASGTLTKLVSPYVQLLEKF